MIVDWIGQREVLLPINHKNYNFRDRRIAKLWQKGKICIEKLTKEYKLLNVALKLEKILHFGESSSLDSVYCFLADWNQGSNYNFGLVDLIYIFECDWLIELSNNKLSAREFEENRSFFKPITVEKVLILMISIVKKKAIGKCTKPDCQSHQDNKTSK